MLTELQELLRQHLHGLCIIWYESPIGMNRTENLESEALNP